MQRAKKIFGYKPTCPEWDDLIKDDTKEEQAVTVQNHPRGYDPYLNCYTNNLQQLELQNADSIGKADAKKIKVRFLNFYLLAFPEYKVNYRYWRAHLKMVGACLTYCNHHLTPDEVKYSLMKLFQRNVDAPKNLPLSHYLRMGLELDEIVEHCIMAVPEERFINDEVRILFNPNKKLSGKERRSAAAKIARAKLKPAA